MGLGRQFLLLMWKNWTLQKRKICVSVFEIIMPVSFALLLVLIRTLVDTEYIDNATTFPAFKPNDVNFGLTMIPRVYILYTPQNQHIDSVMNEMKTFLPPRPDINGSRPAPAILPSNWILRGFPSERELLEFYELFYTQVWAGVEFDPSQSYTSGLPNDVKYSLRVTREDPSTSWRTKLTYSFFQNAGFRNDKAEGDEPGYFSNGFLALQTAIDKAITRQFNPTANFDDIDLYMKKMPYAPFVKDTLITILQQQLPLFLLLSFILVALQTTKAVVYEKERNLKEAMKLMGMSSFLYWFTWFLKSLMYLMIAIAIYTILFSINVGDKGKVLPNSDPSLIYVFLLLYVISVIALCFMISTFFNKANAGAFAGGIIYYVSYIPYYFLQSRYETMTQGQKLSVCLLNNMAMAFGINTVGLYEGAGEGAQWSNFYKPATVDDNFSLLDAMLMLLGDTVLYLLVTWYVDSVHPGEYGVPLPWYFPFTRSYWCGTARKEITQGQQQAEKDTKNFERDPTGLKVGINISHLRKEFGSGKKKKIAVADTTLNMYEGQITALLGHNGAGKTTTMSMLTGFLPPTSGTASVNGFDIRNDIKAVRKSLGLCPQHNILFDSMTVEEHLYFFAMLKGCPADKVQQEIDEMIAVLGLEAKRDRFSSTLSGGQKRKLCVGIAIIAGSKVVILDEPTSGMDPAARRQTWDILQKFKSERTLVLSTHFMDEADLLGDRIAIMAGGVVKCCGTSLFLKKLYGAGYHLIMVKGSNCDVSKVTACIQSTIPTAELKSDISAELSYILPFDESSKFENLFLQIEEKSGELGLASFGISATTMEEVFLKVGSDVSEDDDDNNDGFEDIDLKAEPRTKYISHDVIDMDNGETTRSREVLTLNTSTQGSFVGFNSVLRKNEGFGLTGQQIWGMFVKKIIHTRRNRAVTLVQLLLPVIFTIIALTSEKTLPKATDDPMLTLDLHSFENVKSVHSGGRNAVSNTTDLASIYKSILTSQGYEVVDFTSLSLGPNATFDDFFLSTIENIGSSIFRKQYILAANFEPAENSSINATSYFNDEPFHGIAISLAYMMNTLFKYFTDDTHSISTTNFPFPRPVDDNSRAGISAMGTGFTIAFTILFGVAFLSTSFIVFLIKERSTGAKHLQKVSGVSSFAFWFSNFAWDLINFFVPVALILICFAAFQTKAYTEDNRLGIVFLVFLLFGWSCLPYVYNLHFLFSNSATGMVVVTMLNVLTGLATLMAVFVISIPDLGVPEIVATSLDWTFTAILPNYCLGESILNMYTNYEYKQICIAAKYEQACGNVNITTHPCCKDKCGSNCFLFEENYLSFETPGIGRYVLFMAVQGFVFFCLLFTIEFGIFERILYKMKSKTANKRSVIRQVSKYDEKDEDSDVLEEKRRINETDMQQLLKTDSLVLKNLGKTYGTFRAVKNISVGIPQQECFGLLGQNGAGKTSTFKMLTGDVLLTEGNAYLSSYDIKQSLIQVQQNLGYCPQFDALIEQMTGRETLTMYARLRGVKEDLIKTVVNELLDTLMLRKYADKQCGTYSGGNKRKLSTAIALVGDPPFILLDEPTTGMDPGARRQLWNVLSQVRASGRTLILTSHSMEECDALCTKIAIMVNGRFVCLGSSQHLKNKYGQGYTLIVRLPLTDIGLPAPSEPLREFVKTTFPNSQIFDNHQGYLHFQIPDADVPLARVFGVMESAKTTFNLEDYSVHQTTLEQVFLTFTKNQIPPKEKDKKKMCSFLPCCR